MPISPEQFAAHYPYLYHMAEDGAWASIERHGLLSTSALLDLFEVTEEHRRTIEALHRPVSITIHHDAHGTATIRDQIPMRESALVGCLRGMTPEEWYRMLNGQVFFWVTRHRVETLLGARAYRNRIHTVITVSTTVFLDRYAGQLLLSPINSGSTIYNPRERGAGTFRPLDSYPFEERRRARGIENAIAEVAVRHGVPDLRDFVCRVERYRGANIIDTIYDMPALRVR